MAKPDHDERDRIIRGLPKDEKSAKAAAKEATKTAKQEEPPPDEPPAETAPS